MMPAVTFLIYCAYMVVVFNYTSYVLGATRIGALVYIVLVALNSFIFFLPIYVTRFQYEYLFMIIYVVVLTAETLVVCKRELVQSLFGVFSFAINFFAIRTIVVVTMALLTNESGMLTVASVENRLLITAINMAIPIPYIILTKRILGKAILAIPLSDKRTTVLSTIFLGATFVNQIVASLSIDRAGGDVQKNLYYHLATAIYSIVIFMLVMVINYLYSNLRVVADNYTGKLERLRAQGREIRDIEYRAYTDAMTGFFVRDVAMSRLKDYLSVNLPCFIVFIDMDGLKTVNDTYGHNEGDKYILWVTDIMKAALEGHTIARLGGDEFLVVGKLSPNENITDVFLKIAKDVSEIADKHGKPYQTSVSYGIQEIGSDNVLGYAELVEMADAKMYNFKRERKRNRV